MQLIKKGPISFWEFDLLKNEKNISHGSFLRTGGVSVFPFESLNVSLSIHDNEAHVHANRKIIADALGLPCLLAAKQCHGDHIHTIKNIHTPIPPCDALITPLTAAGLMIQHADCQTALFYDPIRQVIAAAHAGWKGSIQQIFTKTIGTMKKEFHSKPENILACISPSLGPQNAEFIHYKEEFPESFWPFQVAPFHFDFWEISKAELISAGLLAHHIEIAKKCTKESPKDYFSYRNEKPTGRMGTVISII
jgi:polyphenol oxidase